MFYIDGYYLTEVPVDYRSAVVIDRGRVHISPVQSGDDVVMVIGDDSCQHTQKSVLRKPEAVTFKVGESAKKIRGLISAEEAREAGLGQPVFTQDSYDFLGEQATVFWAVPLAQVEGLVWPEFSTERMPTEAFPNGVNLRVSPVSAPEGGKWWAFVSDFPNNVTLLGSSEGSQEIENTSPAHIHNNWVFTKPGTYVIDVEGFGKNADGEFKSQKANITFVVEGESDEPDVNDDPVGKPYGDPADQASEKPADRGSDSPGERPSDKPGEKPTEGSSGVKPAARKKLPLTGGSVLTLVAAAGGLSMVGAGLLLVRRRQN